MNEKRQKISPNGQKGVNLRRKSQKGINIPRVARRAKIRRFLEK